MKRKVVYLAGLMLTISLCGCGAKNNGIKEVVVNESVGNLDVTGEAKDNVSFEDNDSQGNVITQPVNKTVSLAFTGDIYFSDNLYASYQQSGLNGFLSDKIIEIMRQADLYIADHEYVASNGGVKAYYQLYTFRAPLEREKLWQEMGTDIITLANNHTLDYGVESLRDTMKELTDLDISFVGAGNNLEEAITPCVKEVNGKKIAVFGSTRFVPQGSWYATESNPGLLTSYESTPYYGYILEAIKKAKESYDYVIIYVHFGVEKNHTVAEFQKNIAHGYMDAGADLVVGTHPHVLEGIEFYNGKPIVYSLGNFLFGNYHSDTVVLKAVIEEDNSTKIAIVPCSSQSYRTVDIEGAEARKLFDFMESISFDISIDDEGNISPKEN